MLIREATQTDFVAVMAFYRQLHSANSNLAGSIEHDVFTEILTNRHLVIVVAEDNGTIIATCYLNIVLNLTRAARPYAVIENVVTDEAHRGHGLGKAVIKHVLDLAWAARCYKVMLLTGSNEPSTRAFYQSCGFVAGKKTGYIARPD